MVITFNKMDSDEATIYSIYSENHVQPIRTEPCMSFYNTREQGTLQNTACINLSTYDLLVVAS